MCTVCQYINYESSSNVDVRPPSEQHEADPEAVQMEGGCENPYESDWFSPQAGNPISGHEVCAELKIDQFAWGLIFSLFF